MLHEKYYVELEKQERLISRKNIKSEDYNGIYERYQYPVLTREHIPLSWRYDLDPETNPYFKERLGVSAVMNAGAVYLNGKYYLIARIEENDRKSFFGVAESDNGVDNFRFWDYPILLEDTCPEETNVYDMRLTQHEDGYIYGVFCSESKDRTVNDLSAAVAAAEIVRTKDLKHWKRLDNLKTLHSSQQRNVVLHPKFAGKKLSELWKQEPWLFGNQRQERFPLLVKIIDAREDLSIQVHPDDAYAKVREHGSLGKTECWYVMDCPPEASLVVGHNARDRKELAGMIHSGRWEELIREIPVKKGDFIQIDPGTIHAIKGGMMILETQQNSDITYRLYDYGRLNDGKPRELHIEKSMDVITVPAKSIEDSVIHGENVEKNQLYPLYTCEFYQVFKLELEGRLTAICSES